MRFVLAFLLSLCASAQADTLDAAIGRKLFLRAWVPAPASTTSDDGLGPLFDARSCAACHPDAQRPAITLKGGSEAPRGLVTQLADSNGAPDPVYGRQMQREAIGGNAPEAEVRLRRITRKVGDHHLSFYQPQFRHLAYGPLAPGTTAHFRLAPSLIGLGDIEAVADSDIEALSEQGVDGLRGKLPRLADGRIGRFGFKAQDPDLMARIAAAFHSDMGLSTALHPEPWGDCTSAQKACRNGPHGAPDSAGPYEIDAVIMGQIGAFLRSIGHSAAQERDAGGLMLFRRAGCHACHNETLGGKNPLYSDLLLHDMGEGLAGSGPQGAATAREWRTAPLRGLGERLARKAPLLHDGRAPDVRTAILWHDGVARPSHEKFLALPAADQARLIAFLHQL